MAKPTKAKRPLIPSREHPYLVGCSHKQAARLQRAAKRMGLPVIAFIRESALAAAADVLGVQQ